MSQHADKNTKMMTQTIKEWNFFFLIHRHNFLYGFDIHNGKAKPKMKLNTHYKFFGMSLHHNATNKTDIQYL